MQNEINLPTDVESSQPPRPPFGIDAPGRWFRAGRFWRLLPAGMRRRWWLFRALDLLARHWPVAGRREGVLMIRMDGIGDMVLFRSSLEHHGAALGVPREHITILGCKSWSSLAAEVFAGYRVLAIDEHAYARRPLYRFRVNLMVRRLLPEITVGDAYFRRALMTDSLAWVAGAPRTLMSLPYVSERTRPEYTYYLSQASGIVDTGAYPTHEVVRHHRFVSAVAGREIPPEPPRISWREQAPPVPAGAPYVVLNPGSNEPGRRWPLHGYLEVAERVLARGLRVVFVGTPTEASEPAVIAGFAVRDGVIDLIGKTSLAGLLDILAHAAAVVTNDSGPAHLGIALGAPSVVIVGGGHFGCFFPYPEGVAPANARFVHRPMECYHCFWRCDRRQSDQDAFPCVAAVASDQVWAALEQVLAQDDGGAT